MSAVWQFIGQRMLKKGSILNLNIVYVLPDIIRQHALEKSSIQSNRESDHRGPLQ